MSETPEGRSIPADTATARTCQWYKDKTVATLIYPRYENVTSIPVPWRRDYAVSGL